jgi:glutamate racemase
MTDNRPIGIFDSGVGGLSVMREIRQVLPGEELIYFADSGHCPYGTKTREEIQRLSHKIADFLLRQGAKLIVVACNTASVTSLAYLRATFPVPFVGMVPAVKPAASRSKSRRVGIMATDATFQGSIFYDLVQRFAADSQVVRQVCPGLVPAVEKGEVDTPETKKLLEEYTAPLIAANVDTVVLGCTHYVFLRPAIEEMLGPDVMVIDSGSAVARQVARVLEEKNMSNQSGATGSVSYFTTGDPREATNIITTLIGEEHPRVSAVTLDRAQAQICHYDPDGAPTPQ